MQFLIDPLKITNYLLTQSQQADPAAIGKSKFFRGIGYTLKNWTVLREALLQHPTTASLERTVTEPRRKRVYRCSLPTAPNGEVYCIRTVWAERDGAHWFITAYPQRAP
jgi:hypothetical protein